MVMAKLQGKLGKKTSSLPFNRKKNTEDIKWNTDLPSHYLPHLKQSKNNNKGKYLYVEW